MNKETLIDGLPNSYVFYKLFRVGMIFLLITSPFLFGGADVWWSFFYSLIIFVGIPLLIRFSLMRKNFRLSVDDRFVTVREGVLAVNERTVPIEEVVGVEDDRGPLRSMFGLGVVTIRTSIKLGVDETIFASFFVKKTDIEALKGKLLKQF